MPRTRRVFTPEQEVHLIGVMVKHGEKAMTEEAFLAAVKDGDNGKAFKKMKDADIFKVCSRVKGFVKREYKKDISYPKKTKKDKVKSLCASQFGW